MKPKTVTVCRSVISAALLCLPLSQFSRVAIAQPTMDTETYLQHLIKVSNVTVANLLVTFKPHIPKEKRDLVTSDKITVVPRAGFNAYTHHLSHEIFIPVGLVQEIHMQALAYVYTQRSPDAIKYYNRWLLYLADRSTKAALSAFDDIPIKHFWEFAGLPELGAVSSNEGTLVTQIMYAALALVLGHELGHLVLEQQPNHTISPAVARQQELDADDFALKLLVDAGGSALPGLFFVFTRFVIVEEEFVPFDPAKSSHPHAKCRWYRLFKLELDRLVPSAEDQAALWKMTGQSPAEVSALLESLESDCSI